MAQDLYHLKTAFENHDVVKTYQTFQTLSTIFEQQCEISEKNTPAETTPIDITDAKQDGASATGPGLADDPAPDPTNPSAPRIEIREKPLGDRIISSPHNTDAVYTRKRDQKVVGHKAFVTETCDPKNPVQLITDINLEAATHSDAKEISHIEERLTEAGFKPETLYGDAGFVNGESILSAAEANIHLEGPSSGRSQSIENFNKEERPLDTADFKITVDGTTEQPEVLSCPQGQPPVDQRISPKTGKFVCHFEQKICATCPVSSRCPLKIGKRTATLTFDDKQYAGAIRHHLYMSNAEYRRECAIRSGAESLVNEIANTHGSRKSKHKTEKRSRLQLTFSALGCNIKRYVNYMGQCVQNPVISTETP